MASVCDMSEYIAPLTLFVWEIISNWLNFGLLDNCQSPANGTVKQASYRLNYCNETLRMICFKFKAYCTTIQIV